MFSGLPNLVWSPRMELNLGVWEANPPIDVYAMRTGECATELEEYLINTLLIAFEILDRR